jgi:two-component system, NtrC family, nitrogen regulation sensor histidine kinase NtrY
MDSRFFFWNISARVGLLIATSFLFVWFVQTTEVEFIFIVLTGLVLLLLQVFLLTRYVSSLTRVMELFLDAVGKEEVPEIRFRSGKAPFRKLMEKSNAIKETMNARRLEKEKDEQILMHVINLADPGLFCFNSRGEVLFSNESARELISRHELSHLEELRSLNGKLFDAFSILLPGSPRVLRLNTGSSMGLSGLGEQLISVRLKEVKIFDERYKLFSLQNIAEELHKNETDSWQKIIRVLTHEIMNAVTPMLSLSKSLQTRLNSGKGIEMNKVSDGLSVIETTGKGLMDFVEEYRRLSLLPDPKKEKLNLAAALGAILLLFEEEAREKGIHLLLKMEDSEAVILADPQQFEMVLLNLFRNAFDAFPEGQNEKQVILRTVVQENRVLIKVEDNGPGIPDELIDQVFVPFFSTKEKGSGIGLSLVRQVMTKHEGSILLESVLGEGTLVVLVFS